MNGSLPNAVQRYFAQSAGVLLETAIQCEPAIRRAADLMTAASRQGGKIMACGNGGSAADAQHFATELVSRLTKDFERPAIAALSLTTDTSILTAYANDYDFAGVFARQVEALGRAGDVLLLLSSSGNSENLSQAAAVARSRDIVTVAFLGGDGGRLLPMVDCAVVVPSANTQHVQESHGAIVHLVCALVERALFAPEPAGVAVQS